jgi:hypothetical protein
MKISGLLKVFKKAPFPATLTLISFVLFVILYYFLTVKEIQPYYLKGLIFAIPFICFGITTFFSATGKLNIVTSTAITIMLICVLSFGMLAAAVFIAVSEETTITDIGKYERVLKLTGYPKRQISRHFPYEIPSSAKNIVFSYNPPFLQGGENFNLKFETDTASIKDYIDKFSQKAKWIGKSNDSEFKVNGITSASFNNFGYTKLPEDFTIYLLVSKSYEPNNWNHGELSLVAISKERNEIIFLAENW